MQRGDSQQWLGQPPVDRWLADIIDQIRQYTTRTIVVRPHPRSGCTIPSGCIINRPQFTIGTYDDFDYNRVLESAHCVLNWNSGPGVQALLAGVPAFVGPSSLASPIANWDLSQIERPTRPERSVWIEQLSHTEWTIDEIKSGLPIKRLLNV